MDTTQLKKMELSELIDLLVATTTEYKKESRPDGNMQKMAGLKRLIEMIQIVIETKKLVPKR